MTATKRNLALICAALTLAFAVPATTAVASTPGTSTHIMGLLHRHPAPPSAHKKNFIQRHPTMTAVAAGWATHKALKAQAKRDKMAGKKLNWAERHPTMSGIGVGAVTHHVIVKHTPK